MTTESKTAQKSNAESKPVVEPLFKKSIEQVKQEIQMQHRKLRAKVCKNYSGEHIYKEKID